MVEIVCKNCGKKIIRKGSNHKYCDKCSKQLRKERHSEQSKRFNKENPGLYSIANKKRYYNNLKESREYYRNYHNKNKAKINQRCREIRKINKDILVTYKGGKCEVCGYNKCLGALEFHHPDGTKEFGIGRKSNTIKGMDKLKKEADKCMLLCANCHKELHYKEMEV